MDTNLNDELVIILTDQTVEKIYPLVGNKPVSFAPLHKIVQNKTLLADFEKNLDNNAILKDVDCSLRTIQRKRKEYLKLRFNNKD